MRGSGEEKTARESGKRDPGMGEESKCEVCERRSCLKQMQRADADADAAA